ncbi:50S ribosomal protein L6 [Dehalobacterium formicoaceticum]|uniref:Large ribosomal subunit protein uL6 n=1 Tax=Dehalobacterium formicoaceticum TaxID=51515 RepID=A0ABT1Y1X6_9FIRM|nr:50S ribosomal protein L6 [Dehalobacterium formicoaceticum]MCR6543969.1 50S ribosomal protein L6 [Dehalobacterium formicoaceticum]
MSRIGKMPIVIPAGVNVTMDGNSVRVKGPKGELNRNFHPEISINQEGDQILVTRPSDNKDHRALHGLTRTLLNNMVTGVTQGFEKKLELVGVGYRAAKQGNKLVLNVGYSQPVEMDPGADLSVEVPAPTKITVMGIDKEKVGAFAANVRAVREPEPYKGKGIKYEGERIQRKAGKAGVKK